MRSVLGLEPHLHLLEMGSFGMCAYERDLPSSKEGAKLEHSVKIRIVCPSCVARPVLFSLDGSGSPGGRKLQENTGSVCTIEALSPSCLG